MGKVKISLKELQVINVNKYECLNEEAFEYQDIVQIIVQYGLLHENIGFIPILQKEDYIVHMMKIISKLFERTGSLHQISNINIIGGKGINYSVIPKNLIKISDINLEENIINRIQEDYLML